MFSSRIRPIIVLLLLSTFGVAGVLGEAMHLLPGQGHAVVLPNGRLLCLGIDPPQLIPSVSPVREISFRARPNLPEIHDEDDCLVCSFSGLSRMQDGGLPVVHISLLSLGLLLPEPLMLDEGFSLPLQARAPPVA